MSVAKTKRKISASQRDKIAIEYAKELKRRGILSKQTKLHGGRYVSRAVLKKVEQYKHQVALGYKAYVVPKSVAQAAKERGYQVVQGNRVIGPTSQSFRNRIKSGAITGIKPVKGGFMEEVTLPHSVYDMRTLMEQLEEGIDTLKLPQEQFAFKYHGAESYRAFMNTQQLLDYLNHYKSFAGIASAKPEDLQEEFNAFTIFRLHPNAVNLNIRTVTQRKVQRKQERMEAIKRGEYVGNPRKRMSRAERLERMHPNQRLAFAKREREKEEKNKRKRAANPELDRAYKERAKARAKVSRDRKKGK